MRQKQQINVIGGGLAGSEATWQLARRGFEVNLYEMRPHRVTEAHVSSDCAELVCSNSFGSMSAGAASATLKQELLALGAFVLRKALKHRVPAGNSLAVDRKEFSKDVTETLSALPNVRVHREVVEKLPDGVTIVCTGPLTTPGLCQEISSLVGQDSLYFYDAISPIVEFESLDTSKMFWASRYGKGAPDFLNIGLDEAQYNMLIDDLLTGEVVLPHAFEKEKYFESCMPIEALAERGRKTLAFGPLKPVGLEDPKTGKRFHAVVQLRKENAFGTAYNMVGFQTKLKYGVQKKVFSKLPGMENAEFLRLGSLHRNTFLDSPRVLKPTLQLQRHDNIFIAGQLTGTEGYLESSATGLLAGVNVARLLQQEPLVVLPDTTILGGLVAEITDKEKKNFQPMNANMGVVSPLPSRIKNKKERYAEIAARSEKSVEAVCANLPIFQSSKTFYGEGNTSVGGL